ncbi:hypothetical protein [Falsirhodobacter halotolerans]|uniref:hypothetical protein n=1 Tax=Falsirhodobacter halotolerans TaxID=1146892 RepID=UPI001FD1D8A1|nr:hypothetical protein [Falsirhodobacter halotolerans]MCJ8139500.1 hypothetical protein [Falsirhodobacter halotolerans]
MTSAVRSFQPVDTSELFQYPIPATERLDSHFFMTWHYKRWMDSDFRSLADREVRAVAFDLFCVAQGQAPVGTLPTDDRILAQLVDVPLDVWRGLCERTVGPLYNWKRCQCDNGKVRLYHPVALEMVAGAVNLREAHMDKRAGDRERKRLEALPAQMVRAGASKGMAEDTLYVIRLDQFLLEHFAEKQRRPNVVREALEMMAMQVVPA